MTSSGLRVGGRLLGGLLAVAAGGALVWGAVLLPDADTEAAAGTDGVRIDPVAVGQQRVCQGPLLRVGDLSGQNATAISSFGAPSLVSNAESSVGPLQDVDTASGSGATSALVQSAADAATLAAAQAQIADEPDQAGLAVAGCAESTASSWLLGGATDTGRTTLLLLANPSGVDSTVDVSLVTTDGAIEAPGLSDLVVASGSQRILSLAGFAPGTSALAVHVESRGGLVVPALQTSIVRGLEPGGVDLIGATGTPSTDQAIPGLRISTADLAAARARVGGSTDVGTALRVFVPGDEETLVTIGVTSDTPGAPGATFDAEIGPGIVTDIPLDSLADGTYTVSVQSEAPVIVAARAAAVAQPDPDSEAADQEIAYEVIDGGPLDESVVAGQRIDIAWFVSAPVLGEKVAVAVADAPSPRLTVTAVSGESASVRLVAEDGEQVAVEVAAGSTASVDLPSNLVFQVEGAAGTVAAVSYAGEGLLAASPLRPASQLASPITIYR